MQGVVYCCGAAQGAGRLLSQGAADEQDRRQRYRSACGRDGRHTGRGSGSEEDHAVLVQRLAELFDGVDAILPRAGAALLPRFVAFGER